MAENTEIFEGLTPEQTQAIIALVNSKTIRDASKQVKIPESNIYRWLKQKDFQAAYREAKRQTVSQAITLLQKSCTDAVKTLQDVMKDKEAPATSKVAAAKTILEISTKMVEQEEIISRIEELEELVNDKKSAK